MKAVIVLLCLVGLAIAWGGRNVYLGLRDAAPLRISCAEFLAHRPDQQWLELTSCEVDFDHANIQQDAHGTVDSIFIPLRPPGTTGPARIVVQHDAALSTIDRAHFTPRGMLRTDFLEAPSDEFRARIARESSFAPDFVILDLDAEPHIIFGLVSLFAGLGSLVGAVLLWRRARRA